MDSGDQHLFCFSGFFRLSPDVMYVADRAHIKRINPRFTDLLGWSQDEIAPLSDTDLIHPDDLEETRGLTSRLWHEDGVARFENRYKARDGSYVRLEWTATADLARGVLHGVGREIAERHQLRSELEEARREAAQARAEVEDTAKHYQQILNSIQDLVLVKGEKSRIIWANQAFLDAYGMSNEELQGLIDAPYVEPDQTQKYVQDDLRVWSTRQPLHIPEEPVFRHDGTVVYYETVKTPIFDNQENVKMTVGVSRDLTRRKEAEALRKSMDEAQVAKKAAEASSRAKSIFLANMSHELRTPLNAILGYAQVLQHDPSMSSKQRQGLETIRKSGEHLLTLISDILDLSKIEAGRMTLVSRDFHLGDFLDHLIQDFEVRAKKKRLTFSYQELSPLPVGIRADETRLRQVLLNLVGNAIKFTNAGGVSLGVSWRDGTLLCQIEDTGVGIAEAHLEAIFQPFMQVDEAATRIDGAGLGLPISKQLVELMGGTLQVASTAGVGSTFSVEVPAEAASEWRSITPATRMIAGYEGPRKKLLIVDDKVENRRALAHILDVLGFDLVEAGDGEEAIATAAREHPDLIFMDLVMPRLDGFEATRRLRAMEALRQTPIIALSASVFDQATERSRHAGCDGFISKPVDINKLFVTLAEHLNLSWFYHDQTAPSIAAAATGGHARPSTLSREELVALHQAASIGDVQTILRVISEHLSPEETSSAHADDGPVEVTIYHLARRFQVRSIRDLLYSLLQ